MTYSTACTSPTCSSTSVRCASAWGFRFSPSDVGESRLVAPSFIAGWIEQRRVRRTAALYVQSLLDRKSVVEGKRVEDSGGRSTRRSDERRRNGGCSSWRGG